MFLLRFLTLIFVSMLLGFIYIESNSKISIGALFMYTKIMAATTASSRMQPPNITVETTCVAVLSPLLHTVNAFRNIITFKFITKFMVFLIDFTSSRCA